MKPTTVLKNQVLDTVRNNLSKMVLALIVTIIITSFITAAIISPMLSLVLAGEVSIILFIGMIFLLFTSEVVSFFLIYGFTIMLGRFYRKERAVIGHLFFGLRDWKRLLIISLLFNAITFGVAIVTVMPFIVYLSGQEKTNVEFMSLIILIALIPYLIVMILVIFRYLFVFPVLYEEKSLNVRNVLKRSASLLKGQKLKLFKFCIYCAKLPLLTALGAFILALLLPTNGIGTLVSFAYTISVYYSFIYVLIAINAYYYELTEPENLCISSPEELKQN